MTTLTIFTATLVQDSALSVSGVDRVSSSDHPFTVVDGTPLLVGRGLKGAAVAMARRFFELPRCISEDPERTTGLRRSAWEFSHARPEAGQVPKSGLRPGVGILQKTGARAKGILFDREVIPAETRWTLDLRVNWNLARDRAEEAEGILGYVLLRHWVEGRCWLGGAVARGLGWCHIEELKAFRLDEHAYDAWIASGRTVLPDAEPEVPTSLPTRCWYFRTRDVTLHVGEYKPEGDAWGVDMLSIASHDIEQSTQIAGSGTWACPPWVTHAEPPSEMETDRALMMDGSKPVVPGGSLRGPLRHAFSRKSWRSGKAVKDPHLCHGDVGNDDPAGRLFGTTSCSSRVLIRDAPARGGWSAARLHMHAEDEFAGGSYGSAKRDAVRILSGDFPARILVEGGNRDEVEGLTKQLDDVLVVGAQGHLPVGGHKTRGAGWLKWDLGPWDALDVTGQPPACDGAPIPPARVVRGEPPARRERPVYRQWRDVAEPAAIEVKSSKLDRHDMRLGALADLAKADLGQNAPLWWAEPAFDIVVRAPVTFGRGWPGTLSSDLAVDEVAFFLPRACWRAVRGAKGWRAVSICEVDANTTGAESVSVTRTPVRLHQDPRFSADLREGGTLILREWRSGDDCFGYTFEESRP